MYYTRAERRKHRRSEARKARLNKAYGVKAQPQKPVSRKRGQRAGLSASLSAVQYAQYVFRHRNAEWRTFEVPRWYAKTFGGTYALFRKKAYELKTHEKEICLLTRMSWIYSGHLISRKGNLLSQVFSGPGTVRLSDRERWRALRTISRRFIQSDLVVRPLISVTHYLPQHMRFTGPKWAGYPLAREWVAKLHT